MYVASVRCVCVCMLYVALCCAACCNRCRVAPIRPLVRCVRCRALYACAAPVALSRSVRAVCCCPYPGVTTAVMRDVALLCGCVRTRCSRPAVCMSTVALCRTAFARQLYVVCCRHGCARCSCAGQLHRALLCVYDDAMCVCACCAQYAYGARMRMSRCSVVVRVRLCVVVTVTVSTVTRWRLRALLCVLLRCLSLSYPLVVALTGGARVVAALRPVVVVAVRCAYASCALRCCDDVAHVVVGAMLPGVCMLLLYVVDYDLL